MSVGAFNAPDYSSVSVTGSSTSVLALNGKREYALITNIGTATVWVALGATAEVGKGWPCPPGGGLVFQQDDSDDTWIGDSINGITAGATVSLSVVEVSR